MYVSAIRNNLRCDAQKRRLLSLLSSWQETIINVVVLHYGSLFCYSFACQTKRSYLLLMIVRSQSLPHGQLNRSGYPVCGDGTGYSPINAK